MTGRRRASEGSLGGPETLAGQELLQRHPELGADAVGEVEDQPRGQAIHADMERRERVLDQLRHLLTDAQRGAANAPDSRIPG
jgi:hypothetical protein